MPVFLYKASTDTREVESGSIAAPTAEEVVQTLKKRGLDPISVREEKAKVGSASSLPAIEKITFCRYVSTMITSGLSLSEGMAVLKEEAKHPVMKQILDDVLYNLERGQPLSAALSRYPGVFNKFFITLVQAGEVSGTMGESFKYLEESLRADYSLSQKIKGALMYPAIIFTAMTGIGFLMIFFVMPQIGKVFLNMTIPIPELTKTLFRVSITLSQFQLPIILGTIILVITFTFILKKPAGQKAVIKIISPVPVISSLLRQIDIARFCRIFSTLISAAVPITTALEIAMSSLSFPQYRAKSSVILKQVSEGKTVAASLQENKVFPSLLTQMIAGGEKSGTLDVTLSDLASFYEEEVEEGVKKATQLLEPMLLLIVGIGVGGMILSIIAPMYSVVGSLQGQ